MPDVDPAWSALSADTAQVLIIDLQVQIVARSKTTPPDALGASAGVLLQLAKLFRLPIVISVVPEQEKPPELIAELRGEDAFAPQKLRAGASAFLDPATNDALAGTGRRTLIVAGFATEVAVLHAAIDARTRGYDALVPVDACGGMSVATEAAALRQIEAAGAVTTSVVSIATKLAPDLTTEKGKQMFALVQQLRLG